MLALVMLCSLVIAFEGASRLEQRLRVRRAGRRARAAIVARQQAHVDALNDASGRYLANSRTRRAR
jgi:hypothetical protein